jgi:hypothetical protein
MKWCSGGSLTQVHGMPRYRMDARVIGERSDAVLRTAMPAHDSGESGANQLETALAAPAAL